MARVFGKRARPEILPGTGLERQIGPIRRIRLVEETAEALREAILSGKLPFGGRIRQVELAAQMEISRTPLREALMKLEQEGLVTVLTGGGLRVTLLDLDQAVELYEVREVLDGLAARLAAQRIDSGGLRNLEQSLVKMEDCLTSREPHTWFVQHTTFHNQIFQASGNARLQRMGSLVRLSIQHFHPLLWGTPKRLRDAHQEHRGIFEAIQLRDSEGAERLARAHIVNAKEVVLKIMPRCPAQPR